MSTNANIPTPGRAYWRSLADKSEAPGLHDKARNEFPDGASEWPESLSRRDFVKLSAATIALASLSACTKQPLREILPYVRQPEELVPGEALYYATAMTLGGYATGVLVKSREGHPVKVDGNTDHPATLGGSSIWIQASILDLYNPSRSQAIVHNGELSSWPRFLEELQGWAAEHDANRGAGLRFLSETVASPTLVAQINELLQRFPRAKWHQHEPISRDNVREGARLAFGEIVETQYRFDRAEVILSLESDFLQAHPLSLRYAREFAARRSVKSGSSGMNRLYAAESTPTITGMMADHRFLMPSSDVADLAVAIAQQLDQSNFAGASPKQFDHRWLQPLIQDLQRHRRAGIVIAGESQPPEIHALAHAINAMLGNVGTTVFYTGPAEAVPVNHLQSLTELVRDIRSGSVETLLILGGNPAYTTPADFDFRELLPKIPHTAYLGIEYNETACVCTWHIPESHYLESWSDARAFDGTVSIVQPLIAPLYDTRSVHELLDAFSRTQPARNDYDVVHDYWRARNSWPDFEKGWRRALHDGLIKDSALPEKKVPLNQAAVQRAIQSRFRGAAKSPSEIEIVFRPDAAVWDGRFANNGWLQECPRPASKLTWDNAVIVSPALAAQMQLQNDDVVELTAAGRAVRGPVWIQAGQALSTVTLHLGYGRERGGPVAESAGFNAYALRTSENPWLATGAQIRKTGERRHLVSTQRHFALPEEDRQVFRETTFTEFQSHPEVVKRASESPSVNDTLYKTDQYIYAGYKWAMSIDLNTCIGCNACLLACNTENNIPVVGKDQVDRHREMHWIRIDTYHEGSADRPGFNHMPVPCMQCEDAPCELVCPVAATVHDHEGLNLQVYNRCVGTRFCSNNCPYKVRRFNFLQYSDARSPSLRAMYNPDVSVRPRGVMEKCTYCIQRISRARIAAEKGNRRIAESEIQTACQQACPTQAIIFGDLNAPNSTVARLKKHPLDYSMLGGLNTRPRTTYLAKLRNPNPAIPTSADT